jgi:hypothetical protein
MKESEPKDFDLKDLWRIARTAWQPWSSLQRVRI